MLASMTSNPGAVDRRTVLKTAAWAAPVVAFAIAAPGASASVDAFTVTNTSAVLDGDLVNIELTVTGLNASTRLIEVYLLYTNGDTVSSYEVPILVNGPNAFGVAEETSGLVLNGVLLVFATSIGQQSFPILVA